MKIVKTLRYKIKSHTQIFDETLRIYREALDHIIQVIDQEYPSLMNVSVNTMVLSVEKLIHSTKKNPTPKYTEFDQRFYKFPSYLRRSAIAEAFGILKSYRTRYDDWFKKREQAIRDGRRFKKKPPRLGGYHQAFPVFYKGNMFTRTGETTGKVKIFHKNDWVWVDIHFKGQDLKKRGVTDWKENNPALVKVGKKYFLHISYESKIKLSDTKLENQKVCAVDLGLTNSAVCSIIDAKGTVVARKFINQATEKDRLYHMTNKLRKAQRQSGCISAPHCWRRINGLQKHIVNDTAHEITQFATAYSADVIVFEYLDRMKIPKGIFGAKKLRFKLHYWRKKGIQNKVTTMAHYAGIRVTRVNARNTSKLAFDGSGEVERNKRKDLCTFTTMKRYHADLNASYNIGARYYLRAYQKSISEMRWLPVKAKVPSLAKRTSQTLASLISYHQATYTDVCNRVG